MTLEEVSASSVCSGMISLTAPTSVVLPTPNPPATTIFTAVGKLKRAESIDNRLENCVVGMVGGGGRRVDGDPPGGEQITQEHPQDADGEIEPGGQFSHRGRPIRQQMQDRAVLALHACLVGDAGGPSDDVGQQVELADRRACPAPSQRVRAHDRAGLLVEPRVIGHCALVRNGVESAGPDPLDEHRHLVRDEADVSTGGCQHRQARPLSGGGDEEVRGLHLHDGLPGEAATEPAAGAACQALEPRGDRGEVLGVGPVEPARRRDQ